jgi:serine protease inhibitor
MAVRIRTGAVLFRQYCFVCHGEDGTGSKIRPILPPIPNFKDPAWHKTKQDSELLASILNGKNAYMPSHSGRVTQEQAGCLVVFVRAFEPQSDKGSPKDQAGKKPVPPLIRAQMELLELQKKHVEEQLTERVQQLEQDTQRQIGQLRQQARRQIELLDAQKKLCLAQAESQLAQIALPTANVAGQLPAIAPPNAEKLNKIVEPRDNIEKRLQKLETGAPKRPDSQGGLRAEPVQPLVNPAVAANNDFAFDLYGRLVREHPDKNVFFSPYSISSVLALTAEGARGETASQMGKVLRFPAAARQVGEDAALMPWNTALMRSGLAALDKRFAGPKSATQEMRARLDALRKELAASNQRVADLQKAGKFAEASGASATSQRLAAEVNQLLSQLDQYELRVANALWGEKTYPFRKSYLDAINQYSVTGGVFPIDFRSSADAAERARQRINAYIEEHTGNRIKNLIPPKGVDPLTRLVLTNAIYFKGEWAEPFPPKATKEEDFLVAGGQKVKVPLMHHGLGSARYAAFNGDGSFFATPKEIAAGQSAGLYPDRQGFAMLEMPYKGGDLAMLLLVPQEGEGAGLASLQKMLTAENLRSWIGKLQPRSVDAFVPRFKMETDYTLNTALRELGMVRAFVDPSAANGAQFDGMSAATNPLEKLYISLVLHKAFVEINEKGTEAAAATAVIMQEPSMVRQTRPFIPTFRADRPFLFLIQDKQTGTVLFLGRMLEPKG